MSAPFYGKYRGVVSDNQDPLMQGRIKARVPDVLGDKESGWALPCLPFGGSQMGFFAVPDTGAGVWIEFEHGDPDYPVWAGFWPGGSSDMPSSALTPPGLSNKVVIVTKGGNSLLLDDTPGTGGITLQTAQGAKIVMNTQGISIDDGQGGTIALQATQVSINNGALQVV